MGRLSSTLFNIKSTKESLMSIFLVDGSGSINKDDFDGPLRKGVCFLGRSFSESCYTKLGLLQFSSNVKEECRPTDDITSFCHAVTGITFFLKEIHRIVFF